MSLPPGTPPPQAVPHVYELTSWTAYYKFMVVIHPVGRRAITVFDDDRNQALARAAALYNAGKNT